MITQISAIIMSNPESIRFFCAALYMIYGYNVEFYELTMAITCYPIS